MLTEHPIQQVLRKPDLVARMIARLVEIFEFSLEYKAWGPIKAQVLADFIVELSPPITIEEEKQTWKLYVDRLSNSKGSGAGIILED